VLSKVKYCFNIHFSLLYSAVLGPLGNENTGIKSVDKKIMAHCILPCIIKVSEYVMSGKIALF
jgi:hypothetical protein